MCIRASLRSFSLIELLTALSILAIVAGIIVPQYLNVVQQARQQVVDTNLSELSHQTQMWQSLGGVRAIQTYPANQYEAFKMIQFLSTPSNGALPQRGHEGDPTYPTDSLGPGGSYTVTVSATTGALTDIPTATSGDGYYANRNTDSGTLAGKSNIKLYSKLGNQLYPVGSPGDDLATAIFIRTGSVGTL